MENFLHVYIKPNSSLTIKDIEAKLNFATDWFRYSSNLFVVYTTYTVDECSKILLPLANESGLLFICEFNIDKRVGWMPQSFWNWLKSDHKVKEGAS
ncbi:hypothetical protein [Edaphocola flava]|uniref:hypothetical protein n=1 Tax=Edaphocola flava TaxID=2499629 RepID=UPI00100C09AB|nr:hypothetical protein [Edaphocola flava]